MNDSKDEDSVREVDVLGDESDDGQIVTKQINIQKGSQNIVLNDDTIKSQSIFGDVQNDISKDQIISKYVHLQTKTQTRPTNNNQNILPPDILDISDIKQQDEDKVKDKVIQNNKINNIDNKFQNNKTENDQSKKRDSIVKQQKQQQNKSVSSSDWLNSKASSSSNIPPQPQQPNNKQIDKQINISIQKSENKSIDKSQSKSKTQQLSKQVITQSLNYSLAIYLDKTVFQIIQAKPQTLNNQFDCIVLPFSNIPYKNNTLSILKPKRFLGQIEMDIETQIISEIKKGRLTTSEVHFMNEAWFKHSKFKWKKGILVRVPKFGQFDDRMLLFRTMQRVLNYYEHILEKNYNKSYQNGSIVFPWLVESFPINDVSQLQIQGLLKSISLLKHNRIQRIAIATSNPQQLQSLKQSLRKKLIIFSQAL